VSLAFSQPLSNKDIKATIGGTHGFDQSMNYNLKFDVPASRLGGQCVNCKTSAADAAKLESFPITATLLGNFTNQNNN
jgi:hypothetical protein